ncbi:unnamed protein product [Mytilus coruscus]|uniref:DOMON domain-containing protein n=1 Tax=Mytilus coruscus TaxID=42192 RepID=A0A6J8DGP4_MYTCO|nr:unnamed protein product [Mytilus coruscus]
MLFDEIEHPGQSGSDQQSAGHDINDEDMCQDFFCSPCVTQNRQSWLGGDRESTLNLNMSCVIGILLAIYSTHANAFSINPECGETKGCYSDCDNGQSCTYLISWLSGNTSTEFTIQATLSTNTDHYVCFGLSPTQTMDDASVSSCLMSNNGSISYENSYNDGHHNILVTNEQNSKHDKYSLSSQKVDLKSVAEVGQGEPSRIKAHGSIAIIAWMCFMNIGNIIVRYFKPLWSSKHIFGSAVWFQVHRLLMSIGAVLTITSICVIIRGSLKPILGILRPDMDSKYRPVFYCAHYIVGLGSLILGPVNIFIGIQLKKANVTRTAFYFLIVHEVMKCLMIVILEVLLIKEKNIVKQEEKYRLNSNEMHKIPKDNKSSPQNIEDDRPPYAWRVRKILLSVHVFIALTFTLGMLWKDKDHIKFIQRFHQVDYIMKERTTFSTITGI